MKGAPPAKAKPRTDGWAVSIVILVGILLLASIGKCSGPGGNSASVMAGEVNANLIATIAAQAPAKVEALNGHAATTGITHLHLAAAEGLSGEMIYSQNCYDALSRKFSWSKLDQCGAFDLLAVRALDQEQEASGTEADWFQAEAAAGRYLAAATGAGEDSGEADQRLDQLQKRAAAARLPSPKAAAKPSPTDISDSVSTNVESEPDEDQVDP